MPAKVAKLNKRGQGPPARASYEQQLKALIEVSGKWFYWECDERFRYTLVTGAVFERAGIDPGIFLGKALWELDTTPVADQGRWDGFKATLERRLPFTDFLYAYRNPFGRWRYVSANGQPVFDAHRRFQGYRGVSKDVTERFAIERRRALEHGVTRLLADNNSVAEAAAPVLQAVCETLGCACGVHWELDAQAQTLRCAESWHDGGGGAETLVVRLRRNSPRTVASDPMLQAACATGAHAWFDPRKHRSSFPHPAGEVRRVLVLPVKAGAEVLGVLQFFSRDASRPDRELIEGAAYVGNALGEFYRRKQAEEELSRFRAAIDTSGDPIYLIDRGTMRFLDVNETACRRMGYTREELLRMGPHDLLLIERRELERVYDEVIAAGAAGITTETRARAKDGRLSMAELHRRALRVGDKWIIVSIARDITLRKRAEEATKRLGRMFAALSATNEAIMRAASPEELYRQVCDAAVHGGKFIAAAVILPDIDTSWVRVAAITGRAGDPERLRAARISIDEATPEGRGLVGIAFRTLAPAISNDHLKDRRTQPWHEQARAAGVAAAAAVPLTRNGKGIGVLLFYAGEKHAFDEEIVKLLERMAENVAFALDNFEREAERKRAEERIRYLATHDALTGLPNRVLFNQLLSGAIQSAARYERPFALLFVDLDRFKVINDSLGHEAGDRLLQEITGRLRQTLRASDVVARVGGDEFVVLVHEIGAKDQAAAVARKILSAVIKPAVLGGQECRVTASIGVAMYPRDAVDERALMQHADTAMYLAKEEGKNNFQFYSTEIESQSPERLSLEANLRRALENNELFLHYQGKRSLHTGAITGAEALLRWQSPALGTVSPAQIVPLAEETGLIVPIGRWVLRAACRQNVAWQRQGLGTIRVAVNLSSRQFADERLLDDIKEALQDSGMAPELLELELTESMVAHHAGRAARRVADIKALGVRLAIDDFGTGYSSLAQLKRFPIDTLKVDRSFIRDIPNDHEDKAITAAIIAMGKTLGLTVVAEGVETREQEQFLREHACDEIQGYFFSRPIAPDEFAELLRTHCPAPLD